MGSKPALRITEASAQAQFEKVRSILDEAFGVPTPVSAVRVGLLFDYSRSGQLVLLATENEQPIGAAVTLRGAGHANLTHIAVAEGVRARGVGWALFDRVTGWATEQGFPEVRWCVWPGNLAAVTAYLAWGARFVGWLDNGYGVDSDPCNRGETPRLVGCWRPSWGQGRRREALLQPSQASLRERLLGGAAIVARDGDKWVLEHAVEHPDKAGAEPS